MKRYLMSGWERKKAHHSTGMYIQEKVPTSLFAYDNSPIHILCKPPSGPFGKRKLCPADPAASAHARSSACVPDVCSRFGLLVHAAGTCSRRCPEAMSRDQPHAVSCARRVQMLRVKDLQIFLWYSFIPDLLSTNMYLAH